jgi:Mg-chelatase subunit ChlD
MRVRSRWFILSGALGGLVGFLLMEMVSVPVPGAGAGTFTGDILRMSFYFAGFGLAVGIALGMTEGVVLRRPGRAIYGFFMGLILGAAGGFVGGALGQTSYSLVPRTHIRDSTSDLAIALDSSGSMRSFFFWGHDPWGQRKSAAKNLIERLSPTDRVAIVDFDDTGRVLLPLSFLGSETARKTAKSAVGQIDNWGGTNLSAGLDSAVGELEAHKKPGRRQFVIFLTDGQGEYSPESAARAQRGDITVYTVGLGDEVEADLLQGIAVATGGKYYPVSDASELVTLFEKILREHVGAMNEVPQEVNPLLLLGLRTLSWALMGLLIGLGQGIRENTREDLWACAFGGLLGGALGGALFDPVVNLLTTGNALMGRALADIVVGACIGGSMRLAQEKIVEVGGKPTTTLISVLPQRASSVTFRPSPASPPPPRPAPVPVPPPTSWTAPEPLPAPAPASVQPVVRSEPSRVASTSAPAANRPPLHSFETGNDREMAMVLARRAGYGLGEIGQHFGVPATTVKRVISEKGA